MCAFHTCLTGEQHENWVAGLGVGNRLFAARPARAEDGQMLPGIAVDFMARAFGFRPLSSQTSPPPDFAQQDWGPDRSVIAITHQHRDHLPFPHLWVSVGLSSASSAVSNTSTYSDMSESPGREHRRS